MFKINEDLTEMKEKLREYVDNGCVVRQARMHATLQAKKTS